MLRGSGGFKGASMGERKNTAAVSTVLFVFHCTVGVEIDLLLLLPFSQDLRVSPPWMNHCRLEATATPLSEPRKATNSRVRLGPLGTQGSRRRPMLGPRMSASQDSLGGKGVKTCIIARKCQKNYPSATLALY